MHGENCIRRTMCVLKEIKPHVCWETCITFASLHTSITDSWCRTSTLSSEICLTHFCCLFVFCCCRCNCFAFCTCVYLSADVLACWRLRKDSRDLLFSCQSRGSDPWRQWTPIKSCWATMDGGRMDAGGGLSSVTQLWLSPAGDGVDI